MSQPHRAVYKSTPELETPLYTGQPAGSPSAVHYNSKTPLHVPSTIPCSTTSCCGLMCWCERAKQDYRAGSLYTISVDPRDEDLSLVVVHENSRDHRQSHFPRAPTTEALLECLYKKTSNNCTQRSSSTQTLQWSMRQWRSTKALAHVTNQ